MNDTQQKALQDVIALGELATPGDWETGGESDQGAILSSLTHWQLAETNGAVSGFHHNAAFVVAACNWVRQHGEEVAESEDQRSYDVEILTALELLLRNNEFGITGRFDEIVAAIIARLNTAEAELARCRAEAWIPVSDRLPEDGTECLVLVQYGDDPKHYVAIDTWRMQREAPVSFSSATIETGLMWDEHDFLDVLMWQPIVRPNASAIDAAMRQDQGAGVKCG